MTVVLVYVPPPSQPNLDIGLEQSVWGWKAETAEKAEIPQVLQELTAGDYLVLGLGGVHRAIRDLGETTVHLLYVARVTGPVFQTTGQLWPDSEYPSRVPFESLGLYEHVAGEDLGLSAVEALRLSSTKQGAPIPVDGVAVRRSLEKNFPGHQPTSSDELLERLADLGDEWFGPVSEADGEQERYINRAGETDKYALRLVRTEQKRLRRDKFKGAVTITCALCGSTLPERFVHTAHIKPRHSCDGDERHDLANVMGACLLGCDALYEQGDIYVDSTGTLRALEQSDVVSTVTVAVSDRIGKHCDAADKNSAPFFAWHRVNVAGVSE